MEFDLKLDDGRTLHAYDTGGDGVPVFWHHGTPNLGAPPVPLFRGGVRWILDSADAALDWLTQPRAS